MPQVDLRGFIDQLDIDRLVDQLDIQPVDRLVDQLLVDQLDIQPVDRLDIQLLARRLDIQLIVEELDIQHSVGGVDCGPFGFGQVGRGRDHRVLVDLGEPLVGYGGPIVGPVERLFGDDLLGLLAPPPKRPDPASLLRGAGLRGLDGRHLRRRHRIRSSRARRGDAGRTGELLPLIDVVGLAEVAQNVECLGPGDAVLGSGGRRLR